MAHKVLAATVQAANRRTPERDNPGQDLLVVDEGGVNTGESSHPSRGVFRQPEKFFWASDPRKEGTRLTCVRRPRRGAECIETSPRIQDELPYGVGFVIVEPLPQV